MSSTIFRAQITKEPTALYVLAFGFMLFILTTATGVFVNFGLGSKLWYLIYLGTVVFILVDRSQYFQSIAHSWPIFLLPLYAMISTFWSADPARSMFASLQLIVTTFIATWIATRFSSKELFVGLIIATGVGVIGSILNDFINFLPVQLNSDGKQLDYSGIFNQKNGYAKMIDLLVLSVLILGINIKKTFLAILLCLFLAIPLWKTQSAGSILIYLLTMTVPVLWFLIAKSRNPIIFFSIIMVSVLFVVFVLLAMDVDVVYQILRSVGKDNTLTGRTLIWAVGIDVFNQYPLMGVGYQAFWQPGLFEEVQQIRVMFSGQTLSGFHSAYIEVLVALGSIGLCIFFYTLLSTLTRSLHLFFKKPEILNFGMLFMVVSILIIAIFDVIIFRQHEMFYILVVCLFVLSKKERLQLKNNASSKSLRRPIL